MDDLAKLAADLDVAGPKAQRQSLAALRFEARAMQQDWRQRVGGSTRLRGLAPAVGYDILPTGLRAITAEVGYDDRGQGELGNIAEFGTSTMGPVLPAAGPVLKDGADRLERFLSGLDPL